MIFTDAPEVNPNLTLDDLPGTFGDAVSAAAGSALYNSPVWQLKRTWDDNQTQGGLKLDYETARGKAKEAGVDIQIDPKGMTEGALSMLIERKRFQAQTKDALARGPQGFTAGASYFLSGLGAAMLDPINLASAFIPVARGVGMAGDLALAGRLGEAGAAASAAARVGARLRVGAVEGAVGQAMLEPLTAYRASQEQEDYGITDTLMNVGFGTVLGAVAHTGLGAIGDRLAYAERGRKAGELLDAAKTAPERAAPTPDSAAAKLQSADRETNAAIFRSEVAAAADGRKMDNSVLLTDRGTVAYHVSPLPKFDGTREGSIKSAQDLWNALDDRLQEESLTTAEHDAIKAQMKQLDKLERALKGEGRAFGDNGGIGKDSFYVSSQPEFWRDVQADELGLNYEQGGIYAVLSKKPVVENQVPAGMGSTAPEASVARGDVEAILGPFKSKAEADAAVFASKSPPIDPIKVQQAAIASHLPENDVHYDAQAKAEVDKAMAARVDAEDPVEYVAQATQEAQTELAALAKQLGIDPEKNAAMRDADEVTATASRYTKAIEAYVSCQART